MEEETVLNAKWLCLDRFLLTGKGSSLHFSDPVKPAPHKCLGFFYAKNKGL
jgi:hypothetical protein